MLPGDLNPIELERASAGPERPGSRTFSPAARVINVPGCPPIGEVITGCITYLLTQGHAPPCDMEGRPLFA